MTFGFGQQRTQMQRGGALGHVDVYHHGGVLPVRSPRRLGVPSGLDQAHERLAGARQRRPLVYGTIALAVIALPLGDQRITMRRQCRVEFRRIQVRKFDPPTGELLIGGLGDRGPRFGLRMGRVRVAVPG